MQKRVLYLVDECRNEDCGHSYAFAVERDPSTFKTGERGRCGECGTVNYTEKRSDPATA